MRGKNYIYLVKNLVNMLWWKLLFLFNVRRSALPIPKGYYCYALDLENNKIKNDFLYYTLPCKYYNKLGSRFNGCSFLGIITDDVAFSDQCKICSKNYGD